MRTPASWLRNPFALSLVTLAFLTSCGGEKEVASPSPTIPALRFAGVDLEYALERVTTEAGWVLCVDEIAAKDPQTPDLSLVRVDLDIPASSLDDALRLLRDRIGGFDYELDNGVVYTRSNLLVDEKTTLDAPLLEGGSFRGELVELAKYIMARHPSSFITVQHIQGGFAGPPVDLEIPPKASVKEAFILYARTAKAGWQIRRGGGMSRDPSGAIAVIGTTIEPRGPRRGTARLPRVHNRMSGAAALADASARLKTPLLVYDRTVLQDVRGILNLTLQRDPELSLAQTLDNLGASGFGPSAWHFRWREQEGLPVLRTNHFLYFLRGRDLITAELLSGEFEGTLPELARWISTHQKSPKGEVLMGGEIAAGMPTGKIRIEPGDTVHDALLAFAKASGVSPYVLVLDLLNPFSGAMVEHPRAWRGAYLQDLSEWHSSPEDRRADGVIQETDSTQ